MTSSLENLIRAAAEVENTPELRKYWEKKYLDAQDRNLFQISDKTLELVTATAAITKPATTHADILLVNHLNSQNQLQEELLQETIETLVRLLDALLDRINFVPEALEMVRQYRKIAISLGDFEAYLTRVQAVDKQPVVDFLGSFISNKAYRASESLAAEKGPCLSWNEIKQQLRPKSFELWFDRTSGALKNGQELAEEFDADTILGSSFEIIPRRNSHLLLLPQSQEWAQWTDRDQVAPRISLRETADTGVQTAADGLTNAKNQEQVEQAAVFEPMFQIGELVQIQKPQNPRNQDILQVVGIQTDESGSRYQYRLSDGQPETEEILWEEEDLLVVELNELLEILNSAKKKSANMTTSAVETWARAVVLDLESRRILVENLDGQWVLPGVLVSKNQVPEKILLKYLADKYGFTGEIQEEVGSAMTPSENVTLPSQMHLGFVITDASLTSADAHTFLPLESNDLPRYAQILLEKYKHRSAALQALQEKLTAAIAEKDRLAKLLESQSAAGDTMNQTTTTAAARVYKPEVLAVSLGSLSKYVLKLEQLVQTEIFGEVLLTLTYDAHGPRLVNLQGREIADQTQQTLELFLELINFILTNNIYPDFLAERLMFANKPYIQLPIKQLLQLIGLALQKAPQRVQEIDSRSIASIDEENLNEIQKRATLW